MLNFLTNITIIELSIIAALAILLLYITPEFFGRKLSQPTKILTYMVIFGLVILAAFDSSIFGSNTQYAAVTIGVVTAMIFGLIKEVMDDFRSQASA